MLYPRRPQNCFKQSLGLLLSLVILTSGFVLPGDFRNRAPISPIQSHGFLTTGSEQLAGTSQTYFES